MTDKFGRRLVVRTGKSSYCRAYITIRSAILSESVPPKRIKHRFDLRVHTSQVALRGVVIHANLVAYLRAGDFLADYTQPSLTIHRPRGAAPLYADCRRLARHCRNNSAEVDRLASELIELSTRHEPSRIFAIIGSGEGEAKRRARELACELTPKNGADFGVDTIDGAVDNAEQAVLRIHQAKEAIQTLPLFGREKLVWLKNVNFLADTVTGRLATVQGLLLSPV